MGISIWQLLIILVIVLLLFGAKKLKTLGSDLGGAVKGFKESMTDAGNDDNDDNDDGKPKQAPPAVANQSADSNEASHTTTEEKDKV